MRTSKIVSLLREQGHRVSVYKRPDGGIRITSIDGVKFSLSEGNNFGRELVNAPVSSKSYTQRRKASQYAVEGKKRQRLKMPSLTIRKKDTAKQKKEKQAVKKALAKARKVSGEKHRISAEQVVKKVKREGYSKTASSLLNTARHEAGLSYDSQVDALVEFLVMVFQSANLDYSNERSVILSNKEAFSDKFILIIYSDLYEVQKKLKEGASQEQLITLKTEVQRDIAAAVREGREIYNAFK